MPLGLKSIVEQLVRHSTEKDIQQQELDQMYRYDGLCVTHLIVY